MKKVSSDVWQFFDRLEENKRCVGVVCKLCDNEYKYFGNTTNLRAHLMKKHPIQWDLRRTNWNSQKPLDESIHATFEDEDSTNQSAISPKRRKYSRSKDKNVRYSVSINNSSERGGEMPEIEIQRVDVLEISEAEDHTEENEATLNLVQQMHDRGSDEEWLEDDFQIQPEIFEPKRKKPQYRKIKRELVTPPKHTYYGQTNKPQTEHIVFEEPKKDEYSVFGEYIANKLRKFKAPRTRGNIQQLITTILWQAEYGLYDDADAVKRVLMSSIQDFEQDQSTVNVTQENAGDAVDYQMDKSDEINQNDETVTPME